jgi:aspartyl-tRNA(Asn)/glutamyl-tRNA(Gln) amidotransferase subunit A
MSTLETRPQHNDDGRADQASNCASPSIDTMSRRSFLDASLTGFIGASFAIESNAQTAAPPTSSRRLGPPSEGISWLSLQEVSALVKAKKVSPVELTRTCLSRIEALNPSLNAFITVTGQSALIEAQQAEVEIQRGRWRGPLHGIPIALKDLIDTAGVKTTGGSALFRDRIPKEDATVVSRLRTAGAVFLGKLNMQEFAYGGTTVPSFYGRVSNPWDLDRVAGGSSGGPAAAVAAGLCYAALGSDTGGSIRQPAALCGIVGLKPTYGRVSTHGAIPLSWSLDHLGPMTRSVADAAIVLQAIAGFDPEDVSSQSRPPELYLEPVGARRQPWRIGVPREYYYADLQLDVQSAIDKALGVLVTLGGELQPLALEVNSDRTVLRAEAYAYHAEFIAQTPELYLPETLAKLRLGAAINAPTYIKARRDLEGFRRRILQAYSSVDLLITPTVPVVAPKASDYPATFEGVLALDGLLLRNTRPFNLYGFPTVSVPCGISSSGLPIGLQISGPPWRESLVLALARAYQEATDWHTRRPPGIT